MKKKYGGKKYGKKSTGEKYRKKVGGKNYGKKSTGGKVMWLPVTSLLVKHAQWSDPPRSPSNATLSVPIYYYWRLTGRMRRRVEAVIQARGGYTRYWTLNNRCRQVIHKWRFESEMTILSCFLNCEGQYLKWTCFTAKTGLVILWLNIH